MHLFLVDLLAISYYNSDKKYVVITTEERKIMDFLFISKTPLFMGCTEQEIEHMLSCLKHKVRKFKKDEYIYHVGQIAADVCLVLSGSVQIENTDVVGNKSILAVVGCGDIFAESYACIPNQPMLVDVKACEDAEILFINVPALFSESNSCGHGAKLIQNLLLIASRKNLHLSMRIFHSASKTIRGRLVSYFSEQVSLQGSNDIKIPFDRQQLADYLGVERTALSKELGKMRDDGMLTFYKNEFHISINE